MRRRIFLCVTVVFVLALAPIAAHASFHFPGVALQKWEGGLVNMDSFVTHMGNVPKAGGGFVPAGTIELIGAVGIQDPLAARGTITPPSTMGSLGVLPLAPDYAVPTGPGEQILGLFYDLEVTSHFDASAGVFIVPLAAPPDNGDVIFLSPLGRNPLPPSALAKPGSGGVIELYSDPDAAQFQINTIANKPAELVAGDGLGWNMPLAPGPLARDSYVSTSAQGTIGGPGDTLLWAGVFDPLAPLGTITPGVVLNTLGGWVTPPLGNEVLAFRIGSLFGTGSGFSDTGDDGQLANITVIGGADLGAIFPGGMAMEDFGGPANIVGTTDVRLDTDNDETGLVSALITTATGNLANIAPAPNDWTVSSDDPFEFVSVPEPGSIAVWAVLCLSAFGLTWIRGRRAE